jgi:hypothetical protein
MAFWSHWAWGQKNYMGLTIELLTCGIDVITSIIHDFLGNFFLQDLGLISCSVYVREYFS